MDPEPKIYQFEDFVLHVPRRTLYHRGRAIPKRGKPILLLAWLVQAGESPLSNEEIIIRVWPDGDIADGKRSLDELFGRLYNIFETRGIPRGRYFGRNGQPCFLPPVTLLPGFPEVRSVVYEQDQGGVAVGRDSAPELSLVRELSEALSKQFSQVVCGKSTRFLSYDPQSAIQRHSDERTPAPGIPYTLICDLCELAPLEEPWQEGTTVLEIADKPFDLSSGTPIWKKVSDAGYAALLQSRTVTDDNPTIRLSKARVIKSQVHLTLQRANYHDQARSNLILDFDRKDPGKYVSLRTQLETEYSNRLPPFTDERLANTLGLAAMLFYKYEGQWVPYMVRRGKNVAAFPKALHCSASGGARWPKDSAQKTFQNFITREMLLELDEEIGVKLDDLIDLRPIALCREMIRGGKPQLFYGGFTRLDRKILRMRRKEALAKVKEHGGREEIERDTLVRYADVVLTPKKLLRRVGREKLTLEGAAALHFGLRYAEGHLPFLNDSAILQCQR